LTVDFLLDIVQCTITGAMKNANAYGIKKKYMDDLINFFLSLGRELEVVLLQVVRRDEMPKTNYGRR